jgi:hypothetical protein
MSTHFDRISCRDAHRDEDNLDRERDPAQTTRLIGLMDCRKGVSNEDRFLLLMALCHCYTRMPFGAT